MKKAVSVILWLVVIAALAAGIFVIYRYTNGFNEEFKVFYIERDGEKVLSAKSSAEFECGSEVRFDVGYTFDTSQTKPRGYNVQILPNPEKDFEYKIGEDAYFWRLTDGLEEYFGLEKQDTYFTIKIPEKEGIVACLKALYPSWKVDASETFIEGMESRDPFYLLRVSSYNEAVTYDIAFSIVAPEKAYTITFESTPGGNGWLTKLECPRSANAGEIVEFSWEWNPESPYATFGGVTVTGESGLVIECKENRFTMPAENVKILVRYTYR